MHCNRSCQLQISALKWKLNQLFLLLGVWGCWRSALILAFLSPVHVCHLHWLPALCATKAETRALTASCCQRERGQRRGRA